LGIVVYACDPSYVRDVNSRRIVVQAGWGKNERPYLKIPKRKRASRVPVTHTCNPIYSGDRDHEDQGSKPAWANSWNHKEGLLKV
jgi:hypothetical protein